MVYHNKVLSAKDKKFNYGTYANIIYNSVGIDSALLKRIRKTNFGCRATLEKAIILIKILKPERNIFINVIIRFYRNNPTNPEMLVEPDGGGPLNSFYYNANNNLKVITHGWISSDKTEWLQNIRDNYLQAHDCNVITVDWSEIAANPTYVWPALSTRYVGKRVAKLLNSLVETYNITNRNTHLIGHSLGAQVMGYAGMFSKPPVSRVTGEVFQSKVP